MELFSIIIPTRNRHNYLKRAIDYYSDFTNVRIFICDSSIEPLDTTLLPSHFVYRHVPGNTFAQKVANISLEVNTPYVLMCPDDDFMTMKGIKTSVEFLESNKDYSSVQGNYVAYLYKSKNIYFSLLYTKSCGIDINDVTPSDRIKRFFYSNNQLYYSVHRLEYFRELFSTAAGTIKNLNLLECYIGLMSYVNGKYKNLPVFYGCREFVYNSAGKSVGIKQISEQPQYSEEYKVFLQLVADKLSKREQLSIAESYRRVQSVIEDYLKSDDAKAFYSQRLRAKRVKKIIPGFVRTTISSFLLKRNKQKNIQANIDFAKKHPGFPFDNEEGMKELKRMSDIILKHNIQS